MGGSGLQWSFSGQSDKPPQILSFKPASELGNHSIYAPGFVQNAVSAEKMMTSPSLSTTAIAAKTSSFVSRQTQNYGGLVDNSRVRMVASPLKNSPSSLLSNGVGCRANKNPHESVGSVYKSPSKSSPALSSAIVGSTNLSSGDSSLNGPSQMTIFYNGLVCVYDDVAPDKAQAIMLLAGNGNSRNQKQAEPMANNKPPAKNEVTSVNPSSTIYSKPIHIPSLPVDLSASKPKEQIPASNCTSTVEVNARNSAPKFQPPRTCSPPANQIRRSQPAIQVDPVSSGVSTSKVDVNSKTTASTFPTSNQIHFHHSAVPVHGVSASASGSKVEVNPRNPPLRHPSPTSRFRFSPSAITIDPVLASASISKLDNPTSKFTSPAIGSPVSNQYHFSPPVPPRASPGRFEVHSSNSAAKFPPPVSGSVGSNQIRFSQSVASSAAIDVNPKISSSNFPPPATVSTGPTQIRFSRSPLPVEHGTASSPISIVESNPIKPPAKFSDHATTSGPNQFRLTPSANPLVPASSSTKPLSNLPDPATISGTNQFRFSHPTTAMKPPSPTVVESNQKTQTPKFTDPMIGSAPNQLCFSKPGMAPSYMDRSSASGSSTPELVKPAPPAINIDLPSPGSSNTSVEASEASNSPAPAKASGDGNQLRFSHTGVPLARKASLARFMEKRKERPPAEVGEIPIPPSKYRSNSR